MQIPYNVAPSSLAQCPKVLCQEMLCASKDSTVQRCHVLDCVAAQAARDLYKLSSEEEKLALLADIEAFVRSREPPSYPDE